MKRVVSLGLMVLTLAIQGVSAATYTISNINVPGALITNAMGINNAGDIVGNYHDAADVVHGFVYSNGTFTTLDYPNPTYTYTDLYDINNNGDVVGTYATSYSPNGYGTTVSFVYSDGIFTALPDAPGSMAGTTAALGINDDGTIVGRYMDPCFCTFHAFKYEAGAFTNIDAPGWGLTVANGINNQGQIAGAVAPTAGVGQAHGFVLDGGIFTFFDVPGSPSTIAHDINDAGAVAGIFEDGSTFSAFEYSNDAFTTLPVQSVGPTRVGINDVGQIAGHYFGGGPTQGFLATPGSSSTTVTYYFSGSTLQLSTLAPSGANAKTQDSAGVSLQNGNPWKTVGTWTGTPSQTSGLLTNLGEGKVWLGLKNSDDIGTNFDVRIEIYRNNVDFIGGAETYCVQGLKRNAAQAKEVTIGLPVPVPTSFNGTSDQLAVTVRTRIGTNGLGGHCGGHSNAVGLRLYFDSSARRSRVAATFEP